MPQKDLSEIAPAPPPAAPADFLFRGDLADVDPETDFFLGAEEARQIDHLILIASESCCPPPVREALTSVLGNIYAEGYPSSRMTREEMDLFLDSERLSAYHRRYGDRRFYKGTEYANFVECLAQKRAARLFANPNAPESSIFVNVQPLSGAAANNAVYEAFVPPGGTVMGLDLAHGGHLTHGSRFNRSGKRYHIVPYHVNLTTGRIDYDELRDLALRHKPRMIIGGASAYPWDIDWKTIREVADKVGAIVLADISHPAGLAVAGLFSNPVGTAHVTTMTTHKTLCGPRSAIAITTDPEHARKINSAVFPGEQGGPHINVIAAKAVAFRLAATPTFRELMKRVVENAQHMSRTLADLGYRIAYGGTATHLFLIDLGSVRTRTGVPLKGDLASNLLDLAGITLNKNALPGDETGTRPGGIRIGTPWISQLGFGTEEVEELARIIHAILSDAEPFRILTQSGQTIERGKVGFRSMNEARERVQALIARVGVARKIRSHYETGRIEVSNPVRPTAFAGEQQKQDATFEVRDGWRVATRFGDGKGEEAAARKTVALADLGDHGILQVRGARAHAFLETLAAADLSRLTVGRCARTALLDGDGGLVDDVLVVRHSPDRWGLDVFTVVTSPGRAHAVASWFEAHSDGFTRFDPADLYAKIPGPVVVTRQNAGGWDGLARTAFALVGPDAPRTAAKILPAVGSLEPGATAEIAGAEGRILAVHAPLIGEGPEFLFLADEVGGRVLWQKAVAAVQGNGALLGADARRSLRKAAGHPDTSGPGPNPAGSFELPAGRIAPDKPYFVGWKAWLAGRPPVAQPLRAHPFRDWEGALRRTTLYDEHLKLTRKKNLIPFAGWEMPVLYTGIVEEHEAVRRTAGLFDVSHMGVLEIEGEHATRFLDTVLTNAVDRVSVGFSQYNYVLNPDGHALDDLLIYRRAADRYMMVVNASNAEKVRDWLVAVNSREVVIDRDHPTRRIANPVTIRDLKDPQHGGACRVDLALQGPRSLDILLDLAKDDRTRTTLQELRRSGLCEVSLLGLPLVVSRTGYTGEEVGFEIFVHPQEAPRLWTALLEAGRRHGLKPCGLGARDSTRTEAGFPLYGHELGGRFAISPTEAGYGGFVKRFKPFFVGKRPYLAREEERTMKVVRFRMNASGKAVRPDDPVVGTKGKHIGHVTSCTLVNGVQLGLALVTRQGVQEGKGFFVLNLPRTESAKAGKTKALAELEVGDAVPLPQEATVMSRFRKAGEVIATGTGMGEG